MIKIKDFPPVANSKWQAWVDECKIRTHEDLIKPGSIDPKSVAISDLYKKEPIRGEVFFHEDGPFKGRCAFCRSTLGSQFGDIEHFRPKKKVTDHNDEPVMVECENEESRAHPGYYWLAYDWKNLLPACQKCNRPTKKKKMGKRSRFPIHPDGTRAIGPSDSLGAERAMLIHPVFDNPEEHLSVDLDNPGLLKSLTDRGKMTINVLSLNKRPDLIETRKKTVTAFKALWYEISLRGSHKAGAFKELEKLLKSGGPGALIARCMFKDNMKHLSKIEYD